METDAAAPSTSAVRDARPYWRVLLAVCAPVGWLVVGLTSLAVPYQFGESSGGVVDAIAQHEGRVMALLALHPLFALTFVPGVVALVVLCRRVRPVLAAVVGTLGIAGALMGMINPPIDLVVAVGLDSGVDRDQLVDLADGLQSSAATWPLVLMLLFVTVGRLAAGVLLWKAAVVPRWAALAMFVSPLIEFVPLSTGHNLMPALSWILTAIAMGAVSLALLRMDDDEFDLPPRQ